MKLICDNGAEIDVKKIQAFDIRPEDTIVYKIDRMITRDEMEMIASNLGKVFGDNKVLLMSGSDDLLVLREQ